MARSGLEASWWLRDNGIQGVLLPSSQQANGTLSDVTPVGRCAGQAKGAVPALVRPGMEARVPTGQQQERRTPRSAKRGTECVIKTLPLNLPAPDRNPKGQDPQGLGEPQANRAGCPLGRPSALTVLTVTHANQGSCNEHYEAIRYRK